MKQLIQNLRTGASSVVDVPAPRAARGRVVVRVAASLVSAGTERMIVEFAEKNLVDKARARPDLVRQTLDKAKRDGILPTLEAVQNRLEQPMPVGYSVAGVVIDVGEGVDEFRIGDRVAAAGAGHANHAEVVSVPSNLVVKIPDNVAFDVAAFTTVGAIALQGIRLADPKLGDNVAVIGLGLLGQLTVQMLRANGCRVAGFDPQRDRAELASCSSTDDEFRNACSAISNGHGVDAVLITADTKSNEPVALAAAIARDRGVVISVGAVGLDLPRKPYFEKELEFRVSRSYGPGRYDPAYEEAGHDYPYGYVRWTENRNMQAFLQLAGEGKIDLARVITHRIDIDHAEHAYELITGKTSEPFLGVVLTYPERAESQAKRIELTTSNEQRATGNAVIGMLGAGAFSKSVLLPAIQATNAQLAGIAAATGLSARHAGERFGFRFCTTDTNEILGNDDINAIVIATRHNLHASQTIRALERGKHVFVEKPLCLTRDELDAIRAAYESRTNQLLMVGFNRRFAPMSIALKQHFTGEPLLIHYRVNAGFVPRTEWIQSEEGGGRLLGEGIHFIDWAVWLTGSVPESVHAIAAGNAGRYSDDNFSVHIRFANGSVFQLLYAASGDRALGKERIEVHGGGRSAILEDFRKLELTKNGRRHVERSVLRADKGHRAELAAFINAIRTGAPSPIPFEEIVTSTRATLDAAESLR
ncbi:MAG TPA: bi-domain-containing oxidoreductase [Thermoanaerobaculia bacterium]|nr:bi-domain-containing oxidoreductase [Thermoanaerobaculia bacterium]